MKPENSIPDNPCKDCVSREVGCHAYCRDYIEWKRTLDTIKAECKAKRITPYDNYVITQAQKYKKKRSKYGKR